MSMSLCFLVGVDLCRCVFVSINVSVFLCQPVSVSVCSFIGAMSVGVIRCRNLSGSVFFSVRVVVVVVVDIVV